MNSKPVVVIGMGPSGLFLVRQLRFSFNNIYAIGRKEDVGMHSKYILKEKRYYAVEEEEVYNKLSKINKIEGEKPRVYLCSDQYLTMIVNSSHDWKKVCEWVGTGIDLLADINNKAQINQFFQEKGIKIPETVELPVFCNQSNKKFPVIIKWKEKGLESNVAPIGKALVCDSEEMFKSVMAEIECALINPKMLLVQSFIPGNNDCQYSVGGYYKDGNPLAFATVKQIKQYPQGISAQVYTVRDRFAEKVEQIAFDIANRIGFSGFLETEFKIDKNSGDVYLLDINPRAWGWVSVLAVVYSDFYRVLNDELPESEKIDAVWTSPIRLLLSCRNPQNVKADKVIKQYKKAKDISDKEDTKPAIMIYIMALKKIFRRYIKEKNA